jgi:putative salt-induced outer membrane protein YdiY
MVCTFLGKQRRMKMKFWIKAALALGMITCLTSVTMAQDDEAPPKWQGDLGLSLAINTGNSDNKNFSFTGNATGMLSEKIEWVNGALFQYARTTGITSTELYQLSTRINWHHSERVFSFYELPGLRDRFKNYNYRIIPALGVGYKIVNFEHLSLWFKGGLSNVFTKYYDSGETDSYIGALVSDEFVYKFSETAELNQKWDVNLNTSDTNHYLSYFETNLIAQLIKSWSLKLTFINRYDSKSIGDDIKKSDSSFLAGISWKF